MDRLKRIQIGFIFFIGLFIPSAPLIAFEQRDYMLIDLLVKNCYKDVESCKVSLFKINNYQKNAAINK